MQNHRIIIILLKILFGGILVAAPVQAERVKEESGLDIIARSSGDLQNHPDTDWVDWVVVSLAPTRSYFPSWNDDQRADLIKDFDPDFLDMWSGAAMDWGNFFRMRGVATNAPMEYEYQEAINPVAHYGWEFFRDNGIGRKEDGTVAIRPFTPTFTTQTMTVMAPKWHEVVKQGIIRPGIFADAVFQDNLANPLYTWGQGFSDWSNRRFVDFMNERFEPGELDAMGFDPASFRIIDYMKAKRAAYGDRLKSDEQQLFQEQEINYGSNFDLLNDPIIKEFIRFQYVEHQALVAKKADALRRTAIQRGRPVPAFYGNLPRISGLRAGPTVMISQVDVAWSEESTQVQPPFFHGRQAWSSLLYKVGRAAGHFEKPVFTVQYHSGSHSPYSPGKKLPTAVAHAEAHANGGVPVQTWVATEFTYLHQSDPFSNQEALQHLVEVNRDHAQYVGKNRVLFTDRQSVARVALVHSLTSTFWRQFQSLTVPQEHLDDFTAVARYLEESHVPYDVMVLGHPDVFDDAPSLARLDKYDTVILPEVDCVSDRQVDAIADWVRLGGNLILWGDGTGTRDEELNHRARNAFTGLIKDPGRGTVEVVSGEIAEPFATGIAILPTSSGGDPQEWRYSFAGPQRGWTQPDFDDSGWAFGSAPFGSQPVRGVNPISEWTTPDIFLRRTFHLDKVGDDTIFLRMIHWWDATVYINGILAVSRPDRGRIFDGYQDVWISEEARAALRPGENTIAVHCRQNSKHASWGQIIDVGVSRLLPNRTIDHLIPGTSRLLKTDLPGLVWANVWRYGGGPMTSVMLVNYDIDAEKDEVVPQENFKIRLATTEAKEISEAYWIPADYTGGKPKGLEPLSLTNDGAWIEVTVPRLDVFGTVVFSAPDELAARTAAAEARKWLERTKIAQRSLRGKPVLDSSRIKVIESQLAEIQGPGAEVSDFEPMVARYERLALELEQTLSEVTARVQGEHRSGREDILAVEAEWKFDFGTNESEPGWLPVTPKDEYSPNQGYGWLVNKDIVAVDRGAPDGVHRDFIRNIDPADSNWPDKGKNIAYPFPHPPHRPGVFRVDLPDGVYRVTVISGEFGNMGARRSTHLEGKTASTYVKANGKLKLLGEPLDAGIFDSRTFVAKVENNHLDLTFEGSNVGPLYASSIEWLVNGVVIQKMEQDATADALVAEKRNSRIEEEGIRKWSVVGPIDDSDFLGMEREFALETELIRSPVDVLNRSDFEWMEIDLPDGGLAVLDLSELFGATPGKAALALAIVDSTTERVADLSVSLSQLGVVYWNGVEVHRDEYAAGLLPEEAVIPVTIRKGKNFLAIRSLHYWGDGWSLTAGLSPPVNEFSKGIEKDNLEASR